MKRFAHAAAWAGLLGCTWVGQVAADTPGGAPARALNFEQMAEWLKSLYSDAEFRALAPDDIRLEARQCSCYDQPTRHYPYQVVVLSTPKGDLIMRPDQRETQVDFVKLALRDGDHYCGVEPGSDCFGSFPSVCHFTDFRFGETLAPYFPTCKSDAD
jgi:hypothetical protein